MNNEQLQKGIELKEKIEKANTKQTELIKDYKATIKAVSIFLFIAIALTMRLSIKFSILLITAFTRKLPHWKLNLQNYNERKTV